MNLDAPRSQRAVPLLDGVRIAHGGVSRLPMRRGQPTPPARSPASPATSLAAEIYSGPQTAAVTGTLDGTRVHSMFRRQKGCDIARWDALTAVFANGGLTY